MKANDFYFPAEWHHQEMVQLTWPHARTDWASILPEVEQCYVRMALEILKYEHLLIVTPEPSRVRSLLESHLSSALIRRLFVAEISSNDTWARDHGFISLLNGAGDRLLLDFCFNGWGQKFEAELDNRINAELVQGKRVTGMYESHLDFVLEGGSIESDGKGTVLTTSQCLLAPHRNQPMQREQIEAYLKKALRIQRILWLDYGYLAGDDTDSHVDTLARFCPNDTIAYVQCTDADDEHYAALKKMEDQLKTFRTAEGEPYRLIPLPMAEAAFDSEGQRLPATYANFLIMNEVVLMPVYGNEALDALACARLQQAFDDRTIVSVDCRVLIEQHGSLHCCTMQFPCD